MKKSTNLICIEIIFLAAIVLISSCGREEQQLGIDGYIYEAELLSGTEKWGNNLKSSGSWLYYTDINFALYRIPLRDGMPANGEIDEIFNREKNLDYTVDTDGGLYCFRPFMGMRDGRSELAGGALVKYEEDGSEVYSCSLEGRNAVYDNFDSVPGFLAAGGGGKVFLRYGDEILVIDNEGKLVGEADISSLRPSDIYSGTERLLEGEEGRVYYLSEVTGQRMIYELVEEGGSWRLRAMSMKGLEGKDLTCGYFYSSPLGFLYSGIDSILYQYNTQEGIWQELLCWGDSNLWQNASELAWIGEKLLALYYVREGNEIKNEFYLLDRKNISDMPKKEELVLACWDMYSDELEDAVIRYNRSSDSCHITIRLYEGDEGLARLDAGLVSSTPPDLLNLSNLDIEKYAGKQALEDLSGYLEGSSVLCRDSFLEEILKGYTIGGRLVGIPSGFVCFTLLGHTSEVGSQAGWTLEDMVALTERYPGRKLNGRSFHVNLDSICGDYIKNQFIDWESGECRFDSEEFRSLVQWLADHSGKLDGYYGVATVEDPLIGDAYVMQFPDFLSYVSRSGEDVTSIGYPSMDSAPLYYAGTFNAIGIVSKSAHTQEAWQFIEYFLSKETERTWQSSHSFPSRRDLLEEMLEEAMVPVYLIGDGNAEVDSEEKLEEKWKWAGTYWNLDGELVEYQYTSASQEEIDGLLDMIAHTDFSQKSSLETEIMDIIAEEASSYFNGSKPLEDVTEIIQNRVGTLVQENL